MNRNDPRDAVVFVELLIILNAKVATSRTDFEQVTYYLVPQKILLILPLVLVLDDLSLVVRCFQVLAWCFQMGALVLSFVWRPRVCLLFAGYCCSGPMEACVLPGVREGV